MKTSHQEGRFSEVAKMDISCDPADDRCRQMHLLKGDACYQLGRRAERVGEDSTAKARFRCAVPHLRRGIEQTETRSSDWTVAGGDRTHWYTNWAESLRQKQDLSSGDSARATSRRLLEVGRTFRKMDPDAAAPYFYVATARYALLQPKLIDAQAGDSDVCRTLSSIHEELDKAPDSTDDVRSNIASLQRQLESQLSRLDCSL